MTDEQLAVFSVIKTFLGEPRKNWNDEKLQMEFNCPTPNCKHDKNKYNLSINLNNNIFHCWKCGYSGMINKIIYAYGNDVAKEKIELILPKYNFKVKNFSGQTENFNFKEEKICELPTEYHALTDPKPNNHYYAMARAYLKDRMVSEEMISKYKIGYTDSGNRKFRIIIPSYNNNGHCNYYEARSFMASIKPTYLKPDHPNKTEVIFNESNINFDLPVYLVEGVFDMFPIYNAIPLLGKNISHLLLNKLMKHQTKVILCLDEDAIEDTEKMYNLLSSVGLEVYFVDIPDDIASYYKKFGKEKLIDLLKGYKKMDFRYYAEKKLSGGIFAKSNKANLFKYELDKLRKEIKNEGQ